MTVYVLSCNWATDGSCDDYIEVYESYEKAVNALKEAVETDKREESIPEYWLEDDFNLENYYRAWREYEYCMNHIEYKITECEVQ